MVTIYGQLMSRAARCLWALEEIGVNYQHVKTNQQKNETHTPEFRKINPMEKIPAMTDGSLVLFESAAINLYLAHKYGQDSIGSRDEQENALFAQWAIWSMQEVEVFTVDFLRHQLFYPDEMKNPALAANALAELPRRLRVADDHLGKTPYLVGSRFTVADVTLASCFTLANLYQHLGIKDYPNMMAWLERCMERPAHKKLQTLG